MYSCNVILINNVMEYYTFTIRMKQFCMYYDGMKLKFNVNGGGS